MDVILSGSFSHVTIKWIQEQDAVLFGSPSHVTMMLKVDPRAESRGRILIKKSSIKVIDARKSLTDKNSDHN